MSRPFEITTITQINLHLDAVERILRKSIAFHKTVNVKNITLAESESTLKITLIQVFKDYFRLCEKLVEKGILNTEGAFYQY